MENGEWSLVVISVFLFFLAFHWRWFGWLTGVFLGVDGVISFGGIFGSWELRVGS